MDEQQINARLLANPDDDELVVIADALQAIGDPRGELIALQLAGKPIEPEYGLEFTRGWFTLELEYPTPTHYFMHWQAVAPWIRTIRIRSPGELPERFLEDLCRSCPYLETLALHVDAASKPSGTCHAIQSALDLAPRLRVLELQCDHETIRPLAHSRIRRLHAIGGAAAHVLLAPDSSWPNVSELAFEPRLREDRLRLSRLSTLRVLDLSITEPPPAISDVTVIVEAELEHLSALEHLRLPAIRTVTSFERIQRITRALPRLDVEVVRAYRQYQLPAPPRGIVLPVAVPWPPPRTPRIQMYVDEQQIEMEPLLRWLDSAQPMMTTTERDAWFRIFAAWDPRESKRWSIWPEIVAAAMTALPARSPLRRSMAWRLTCQRHPSIGRL